MKIQSQHSWKQGAAKKRMYTSDIHGRYLTFTFTVDAMPGYTKFNKTKKVLAAIQIIEDVVAESDERRPPCNGENGYLITWEAPSSIGISITPAAKSSKAPTPATADDITVVGESSVEVAGAEKYVTINITGQDWGIVNADDGSGGAHVTVNGKDDVDILVKNSDTKESFNIYVYKDGQKPV